jgi:FKBP-type peptidyl-prolyl cis-trans isomerase 2
MRTAQPGDRVQVHYVKRFQDGSAYSSHDRPPVELTVGTHHPRLPGLGLALVGLAPGSRTTVRVPAEQAYGVFDPARVRRWSRARFPQEQQLPVGKWVPFVSVRGKRRLVRVLEVHGNMVVVDTNRRWAGQTLEMDVEILGIEAPTADSKDDGRGQGP